MKVLCNLITKKIEGYSRRDDIPFEPSTHIVLNINYTPDVETERLNNTNDGLRPITQGEIDSDIATELDEEADIEVSLNSTNKAFALVVLDEINILRSQVGLSTRSLQQLKNAVKAKL